jgi:hypothetical protein
MHIAYVENGGTGVAVDPVSFRDSLIPLFGSLSGLPELAVSISIFGLIVPKGWLQFIRIPLIWLAICPLSFPVYWVSGLLFSYFEKQRRKAEI